MDLTNATVDQSGVITATSVINPTELIAELGMLQQQVKEQQSVVDATNAQITTITALLTSVAAAPQTDPTLVTQIQALQPVSARLTL